MQIRTLSLPKGTNLSVEPGVSTLPFYSVQAGSTSGYPIFDSLIATKNN
ncbi:MAG: hypothetical protein H6696_07000 [Deferribacteres bacterium]|nr:hypothetical protein [candidate division KSB1 bacterium]MCB9501669.1 hypothetical protein [Deferribacteres bacterium]